MGRRKIIYSILFIIGTSTSMLFQNCGSENVSFKPSEQSALGIKDGSTSPEPMIQIGGPAPSPTNSCVSPKQIIGSNCVCPAGSVEDATAGCLSTICSEGYNYNLTSRKCEAAPRCQAGYAYDGHSCVVQTSGCQSYNELKITDKPLVLPTKVPGVCYYVKLIDKVTEISSSNLANHRMDIFSNDQDGSSLHPHIIGEKTLSFQLPAGNAWHVVVAGDSHGQDDIAVDNYFLAEISYASIAQPILWAAGTADSIPANGPITVNGQALKEFEIHGVDTISNFNPKDLTSKMVTGELITLRASALDAGHVAKTSEIDLIFR